jgi:hypothetical protein
VRRDWICWAACRCSTITPPCSTPFFAALWGVFPGTQIWRAKSVTTTSRLWQYLHSRRQGCPKWLMAFDGPTRPFYSIRLGECWTDYLGRFTAKQRHDLKRKERILSDAAGGRLELRRVETEEGVTLTYGDLAKVASESLLKPGRRLPPVAKLQDAARRGCLRSYVQYMDGRPVAYVIGYQGQDIFHYSDVAFSLEFVRYSPGTVLLYGVIRDLCEYQPVQWLNFGIGNAEYKRRFSNVTTEDATVFLMRPTLRNRVRIARLRLLELVRRARSSRL